jgi:hypothetical protein
MPDCGERSRSVLSHTQLGVLAAWIGIGLALVGVGLLVRRLARAPARDGGDLLESFWLGWCVVVLGLQLWHLVLPVDGRAAAACAMLGLGGLAAGGLAPWRQLLGHPLRHIPALVLTVAGAVWLSQQALGGPRYGDTGAYFIPTIRWLVAFPIVPGLGNLHGHYAFNQSYFLYAAVLESTPFAGGSSHLANGLLVLALWAELATALGRVISRRHELAPIDVYRALLVPGVLAIGVGMFLTTPTPDIAVFALGAVMCGQLIALHGDVPARATARLYMIVLLAVTGITVKLSFAGMALATLPVAFAFWLMTVRPTLGQITRRLAVGTAIGLAGMGPWIGRSIVLSGYPFFPSAALGLPVEWRVQFDMAGWMGWLRESVYGTSTWATLRNTRSYLVRLGQLGFGDGDVAGPLAIALVGAVVALGRRMLGPGSRAARMSIAILLPGIASLVYTVLMCPVPRYLGATQWVLAAQGVLLALGDVLAAPRRVARGLATCALVAATALAFQSRTEPLWRGLQTFEPVSPIRTVPLQLETGLTLYVPQGDACWDAPFPCTPFPNPALKLRQPGDLSAGFMVDPVLQERYHYEPRAGVARPAAAHP